MGPLDVNTKNLARILGVAGAARRLRMSIDEAFIFMAIGHLGISLSRAGFAVKPISCADVAQLLGIPKETVRRKALRLVALGLISKNTKGLTIDKIDDWLDFVGAVTPE
jgi:CRP-like cAMP-binding protein